MVQERDWADKVRDRELEKDKMAANTELEEAKIAANRELEEAKLAAQGYGA